MPSLSTTRSSSIQRLVAIALILTCISAGCSGARTYYGEAQKNLFISTDTPKQGWFSSVDAELDIYEIFEDCDVGYRGTVDLSAPVVEVGVPEGVPAYLVFRVDNVAFMNNSRSTAFYDLALYPEYGQVYDVNVTYRDNLYDVEVEERRRGESAGEHLYIGRFDHDCQSDSI